MPSSPSSSRESGERKGKVSRGIHLARIRLRTYVAYTAIIVVSGITELSNSHQHNGERQYENELTSSLRSPYPTALL